MSDKFSISLRAVIAHADARADRARFATGARDYLSELGLPDGVWGQLEFASTLNERWRRCLDAGSGVLGELRGRLDEAQRHLRSAADAYAAVETESEHGIKSAAAFDAESPRGDGADDDLPPDTAPALPDPTTQRDSPGGEAMAACREEHLSTLKRAERLLDESGRLDFTAPSEYLRRLSGLRPGVVGGHGTALAALSSALDQMKRDLAAGGAAVSRNWEGETAAAFAAHDADTTRRLGGVVDALAWHAREAEELWRLLDGLAGDIAESVWGRVESVGASRITRIRAAVSLVEDARGYTLDAPSVDPMWGSLSDGEVEAVTQVLYKRVWYLANAMSRLVADAGDSAATRLDPANRPVTD